MTNTAPLSAIQELFQRIGLAGKGQEAFLTLLELGPQPASVIAKHVHVPRSSMYVLLKELEVRGLVEEFNKGGIKYFRCVGASGIADLLRSQEKHIRRTLAVLQESIPLFEVFAGRLGIVPTMKFYDQREAIGKLYESMLREKEFIAASHPAALREAMPEYHQLIPEAVAKNKGEARVLLVDSADARVYRREHQSRVLRIKFLPPQMVFRSDTFVSGDRVCHMAYGDNRPWAAEVRSHSLAEIIRKIFDQTWATLP